jgi:hypothetical protein
MHNGIGIAQNAKALGRYFSQYADSQSRPWEWLPKNNLLRQSKM